MSSITYHQGNAYFKTTVGCYVLYIRMPLWKMEKRRVDKEKNRGKERKEGWRGEGRLLGRRKKGKEGKKRQGCGDIRGLVYYQWRYKMLQLIWHKNVVDPPPPHQRYVSQSGKPTSVFILYRNKRRDPNRRVYTYSSHTRWKWASTHCVLTAQWEHRMLHDTSMQWHVVLS